MQAGSPTGAGVRQTAYHILVASSPDAAEHDQGDLWNSGTVQSPQMNQIAYAGKPLKSAQQVFWKVRVIDSSRDALSMERPRAVDDGHSP